MPNNPGATPPQPPSMAKRLPLALALMMLVLVVSQYIFKPAPGPKPVTPVNDNAAAKLAERPAAAQIAKPVTVPNGAGQIQAPSEVTSEIDTDLYRIVFDNRGALVKSWVLRKYQDNSGKQLQLINTEAKGLPLPFSIETTGQKLRVDPNAVLYQPKVVAGGTGIQYEFSNGTTTIEKSFQFSKDSYECE